MKLRVLTALVLCSAVSLLAVRAQRTAWRQASEAELASILPSRAAVVDEHIETEMRTASGIVDARGRFIAGVVLITAGYSAEGKYSHYLIVQAPLRVGGVLLKPGSYVFGWNRSKEGDSLTIHFNTAETGDLVGTAQAHWLAGSSRVESLHIWPPGEKSLFQIGRFGIPYSLAPE
jgi:hypothetical protein